MRFATLLLFTASLAVTKKITPAKHQQAPIHTIQHDTELVIASLKDDDTCTCECGCGCDCDGGCTCDTCKKNTLAQCDGETCTCGGACTCGQSLH